MINSSDIEWQIIPLDLGGLLIMNYGYCMCVITQVLVPLVIFKILKVGNALISICPFV